MARPLSKLHPPKILAACALVAVAATIALAIKSRADSPAPAAQGQQERERLEVEYITLWRGGFDPAEITRPHGRFVLAINNRTSLEEVEIRLERQNGGSVRAARLTRRKRNWSDAVELPPGRYLLTEANHPEWKCLITITPRGD